MIPTGVRERPRVELREALGENGPELSARERPLLERRPCDREHRPKVQASERRAELGVAGELRVEDGLRQRPEDERVIGGDEVDRRSHQGNPHDPARLEELGELLGPEALESRPERRVRVMRFLRLESDEVPNRVECSEGSSLEQELPRKRRAVQGSRRQGVCAHRKIVVPGSQWCAGVAKWVIVV